MRLLFKNTGCAPSTASILYFITASGMLYYFLLYWHYLAAFYLLFYVILMNKWMRRIEFKICVLVFKSLVVIAQSYVADMLQRVATLRRQVALRSVTNNDSAVPRTRLRFGERAFMRYNSGTVGLAILETPPRYIHSERGWRYLGLHFANTFIFYISIDWKQQQTCMQK